MSDAAPPPTMEWAQMCSRELRFADRGARRYLKRDWAIGRAYWTGEEWRIPMVRALTPDSRP